MDERVHSNDAAFLSWVTMCFKQKEIGTSVLDAYMATIDGSVPAIQYCVTVDYYHTESMPVILYEAENF